MLDVFVGQIQEPAGSRGIGDLTGQPAALLDLSTSAVSNEWLCDAASIDHDTTNRRNLTKALFLRAISSPGANFGLCSLWNRRPGICILRLGTCKPYGQDP